MCLDNVSDARINSGLLHENHFLPCFKIGKDGITSLSMYKHWTLCLVIGNVVKHIPSKKITEADAQHVQDGVMLKHNARTLGNMQDCAS